VYRPSPPDLWRVPDAVQRISELLRQQSTGLRIEECLPTIALYATDRTLRLRAALASTLVAGLELARDGALMLEQTQPFGSIILALPRA
jgi:segregation and condensation protein A